MSRLFEFKAICVKPPYPEGGHEGIQEKLYYPDMVRLAFVEGKLLVELDISEKGEVDSFRIIESVFPPLDSLVVRILREIDWQPATNNGKFFASRIRIPIFFNLYNGFDLRYKYPEDMKPIFDGFPLLVNGENCLVE